MMIPRVASSSWPVIGKVAVWTFLGCAFSGVLGPIVGTVITIGGIVTTFGLAGHRFTLGDDDGPDDGSGDGGDGGGD